MTNGNGTNKLVWLLFSLAVATLLAVSGAWAMNQVSSDQELSRRVSALERQYEQINSKLDMLLEERGLKRGL